MLVAVVSLALQIWGSYRMISFVFRLLSLALLSYVVSMFLAHPDVHQITRAFVHPGLRQPAGLGTIAIISAASVGLIWTWIVR